MIAPPWLPVPPVGYGGTEAVIDRLARGMVQAGHDVVLFTTGDSRCPVRRRWLLPRSVPHLINNGIVELRHVLHAYEAVADCDIVHDHTLTGMVHALSHPELQVVTTCHGPFGHDETDIFSRVARRVPVIAISHCQAASALGVPIAAVIHHGIDLDAFPVGDGGGDADGDYFVFLGRMSATKGAREAAQMALAVGARLLIAAKMRESAEYRYFDEQVAPLLGDDVVYLGEVAGADKLALLGGAKALLNPISWPEPFGLVMIEAMASGTPVLTLPNGAAPEIVDDGVTGFLCADVEEMAKRMSDVDTLDRSACRRAVEERFSTQRMVAEHLDLYTRVLAGTS